MLLEILYEDDETFNDLNVYPPNCIFVCFLNLSVGEKEPLSIIRGLVVGLGHLQQIFNEHKKNCHVSRTPSKDENQPEMKQI